MSDKIKSELYQNWQHHEALLQSYRGMAITLMALIAAGCFVIMSIIVSDWDRSLDLWINDNSGLYLWVMNILTILLASLIYLGFRSTTNFSKITSERAMHVTIYQDLLFLHEQGRLEMAFKKHDIPVDVSGYPLFTISRFFKQRSSYIDIIDGSEKNIDNRIIIFINELKSKAALEHRHGSTRKYLQSALYRIFYIVWFSLTAFTIVYIWHSGFLKYLSPQSFLMLPQ